MHKLSIFIYKDGNTFYFDKEGYDSSDEFASSGINYEQGDMIKWNYEGSTYIGTLREVGVCKSFFEIDCVRKIA
jgi:hypothetical protein